MQGLGEKLAIRTRGVIVSCLTRNYHALGSARGCFHLDTRVLRAISEWICNTGDGKKRVLTMKNAWTCRNEDGNA